MRLKVEGRYGQTVCFGKWTQKKGNFRWKGKHYVKEGPQGGERNGRLGFKTTPSTSWCPFGQNQHKGG